MSHFFDQTYSLTEVFRRQKAGRGHGKRAKATAPSQAGKAALLQRPPLALGASKCSRVLSVMSFFFLLYKSVPTPVDLSQ